MAGKRLSLMLEECGNLDQIKPRSAKRHKANANAESPLQRMLQRQISGNSCGLSPISELVHNMRGTLLDGGDGGTPKSSTLRSYNSVSSSYDSSNSLDDEYMALFELETLEQEQQQEQQPLHKLPGDLDALISGPIKSSARRCLSMSQPDTPKHRSQLLPAPAANPMRKVHSMNDADILSALGDEPELIGDLSKPCALPVLLSGVRHRDLKTINCETLARLLRGEYSDLSDHYTIIDCRYPYEFDGGHIRGALNLYTRAQIQEAFPFDRTDVASGQRRIYVFHCEFSSERGPKLLRYLRSSDRNVHTHNYPTLDYPELYLLHNGYKEFYASHGELCQPRDYVPMLAPAHNEEYRLCRAKTKSWQSGDSDSGIGGADGGGSSSSSSSSSSRSLTRKSRSRLLYAE